MDILCGCLSVVIMHITVGLACTPKTSFLIMYNMDQS